MLGDLLGVDYAMTTDVDAFKIYTGAKLSYAKQPIADELFFASTTLLYEDRVKQQLISTVTHENIQGFYPTTDSALPFDIFASAFYFVSCYDEYLVDKKDKYGRFRASQSMNHKLGFLSKPMVNYYALVLEGLLNRHYPTLPTRRHPFKYMATVDIDIAYSYLHKGFKRGAGAFMRSFMFSEFAEMRRRVLVLMGKMKDPYDTYEYFLGVLKKYNIDTRIFFLLGDGSRFDKNTPHCKLPFRQLVKEIADKYPTGVHLSFKSHISNEIMKMEKGRMEEITGHKVTANRFHYLRFTLPKSYDKLIRLGITDDHSMGYAPHPGFRAGICTPYYFFNLEDNAVTTLKVHPIAFMDTTFAHYKKDDADHALDQISEIMGYVKETGGTMVGLWHNSSFTEQGEWKGYRHVFESVAVKASALMEEHADYTHT